MGNFEYGTRIVSGMGAISMLKELNIQRLLLVSDPYFVQNGWAQKIGAVSGAKNIQIFDKVQPDPTVLLAAEGTAAVREFQPDAIVALTAYSEHVDYLTKWMRDRKQWLDNAFAN